MPHNSEYHSGRVLPGLGCILKNTWKCSRGSISLASVGLCTAFFLVVHVFDATGIGPEQGLIGFFGLSYFGIFHHVWIHQFVTAPLMHGGVTHLLFNMLVIWMLGPSVEQTLGRRRYVILSVLCAESSMIGFLLFNLGTGNIVVGYSGVIFGILVAQAVFFPDSVIYLFAFFPMKMKHAVLLMGAVELYLTISPEEGGVSHAAHLFGAVDAFAYLRTVNWRQEPEEATVKAPKKPAKRKPVRQKRRNDIPKEL